MACCPCPVAYASGRWDGIERLPNRLGTALVREISDTDQQDTPTRRPTGSRTQTLECVENGELLQITYEQAKQLYYQNPQFGFYFIQLCTRRLFQDIARLESQLAACQIASAPTATG